MLAKIDYLHGSADWSCFLSDFEDAPLSSEPLSSLNYYTMERREPANKNAKYPKPLKIGEVYKKLIFRGTRAYLQPEVEEMLFDLLPLKSRPLRNEKIGHSVAYITPKRTLETYQGIQAVGRATQPVDTSQYNPFDPDNPKNERVFYEQLIAVGGATLAGYIYPQCPLDRLLPPQAAKSYKSQRLDFLVMLPNGKGIIFEPGDHGKDEESRDKNRDDVCLKELGLETIRFENHVIGTLECIKIIKNALRRIGSAPFLKNISEEETALLSPFVVHRVEAALHDAFFNRGLYAQDTIKIGFYCDDMPCAEIAAYSFFNRLENLSELFEQDESLKQKDIDCVIYSSINQQVFERCQHEFSKLKRYKIRLIKKDAFYETLDVLIDVSARETNLKPSYEETLTKFSYCLRNSFPHHIKTSFRSYSIGAAIEKEHLREDTLNPFVRECFRLNELRPDQFRVLEHLLSSGDTIGLLPTGGGKSLCYQLAGLLTPGVCLIIDPLVALMEDQAASLRRRYRISNVKTLHSSAPIEQKEDLFSLFEQNLFLFISPERFLRINFRKALFAATQTGYRIGLAVVDEAHCVSMWGHDFRPAYLELAKNIRKFAKSEMGAPPILALSGTASQLVLIDLSRQLLIYGDDAVIRPKSFDRPELNYRVLPTANSKKEERLKQTLKEVQRKLGSDDILKKNFGIIFGITRTSIFETFRWIFGEKQAEQLLCSASERDDELEEISAGMYTGTAPKEVGVDDRKWSNYKTSIFEQFVGGKVRCMVANNALSVGIDHQKIRYVINVSMPASLESYYQQAGRAGRDKSESYCDLIFSDDNPSATDEWLQGSSSVSGLRGDIGTLRYFHNLNFPGVEHDQRILSILVRLVFKRLREHVSQYVSISYNDTKLLTKNSGTRVSIDDIGRFIGYLSVLGIIEDYTVSGMKTNTIYALEVPEQLVRCIEQNKKEAAQEHVIGSLHEYYCRYKPVNLVDIKMQLNQQAETETNGSISIAACNHLIRFIYDRIAYQRRESIGTMVEYCRQSAKEPDKARQFIKNYFDRSAFSEALESLSKDGKELSLVLALNLLKTVEDYEDAEQIFWGTRRLLDESPRIDWSFLSVAAELYCGRETVESGVDKLLRCLALDSELACSHAGAVIETMFWIAEETKRRHFKADEFISLLISKAYHSDNMRDFSLNALESTVLASHEKLKLDISQNTFNSQMERLLYVAKRKARETN
jgi:hypothetical protein